MGVVSADRGDAWVIRDLVRKKFIQALDGKRIENPSAFVNTTEGQELKAEILKEVEDFVGYTLEDSLNEDLNESLADELRYASRTLGDEKCKDGLAELESASPEDIM